MKNNSHDTLARFIRRRLIVASLLLSSLFGYAMFSLYEWGLDDASETYLYADAYEAEKTWEERRSLPSNTALKQFYLDLEQLPVQYHALFDKPITAPVVSFLENQLAFDYVLAYPLPIDDEHVAPHTLFVVHSFAAEDNIEFPGMTVAQVFGLLLMVAVSSAVLLAGIFLRNIETAMRELQQWAGSLKQPTLPARINPPPATLRFQELLDIGTQLHEAVLRIDTLAEREKAYVRSLSHELRTPMAIIGVALDLIEKRELSSDIGAKIQKIRSANTNMTATADVLLRLWSDENYLEKTSEFELSPYIDSIVNELKSAGLAEHVVFVKTIPMNLMVKVPKQAYYIAISNLLRNASQYTHDNQVYLEACKEYIEVINTVDACRPADRIDAEPYGFGLGWFIVETLANRYRWGFSHQSQGKRFCVRLVFAAE